MPVPVYNHDLVDYNLAEATGGWLDFTSAGVNASGGISESPSFSMQGTNAIDKGYSGAGNAGIMATGATIPFTGEIHSFHLFFVASPGVTDTLANGGVSCAIGDGIANQVLYHVEGFDTYGAGGRVGKCYAIKHNNTASAVPPYRTIIGSPSASPSGLGAHITSTSTARIGVDAMRYGTGAYITEGEIGDPATFTDFSAENDLVANRWGIAVNVNGSIEIQGKFVIGQNSSQVATLCYFEETNVDILFVDAIHADSGFNEIKIDHASTICNWNTVNIKALGTNTRGKITVEAADPTVTINGGVWTGIDVTVLRSNSTLDKVTWRNTESITLNGASLTDCTIDVSRAVSAVITDDLALISSCTFNSSGTGHAIDLGTISATVSMAWNNNDTDYAATNGSTGNETILVSVAASQTLTINVASGKTTPTINNTGAGTVLVVSPQPLLTIQGLIASSVFVIYDLDDADPQNLGTELQRNNTALVTETYSYAGAKAGDTIIITMYIDGYKPLQKIVTLLANDSTITLEPQPESN